MLLKSFPVITEKSFLLTKEVIKVVINLILFLKRLNIYMEKEGDTWANRFYNPVFCTQHISRCIKVFFWDKLTEKHHSIIITLLKREECRNDVSIFMFGENEDSPVAELDTSTPTSFHDMYVMLLTK